jgi:hypothetical protein
MFEPSFTAYVVGKRNSGKSTLLLKMLLNKKILKGKFDEVIIINPTIEYDEKYKIIKFTDAYSKYSIELMEKLMNKFEKDIAENTNKKTLLILDDCITQQDFKSNTASTPLNTMFVNGRHWGLSIIVLSQKYNGLSSYARTQLDYVFMIDVKNNNEIKTFYDEYGSGSKNNFVDFFKNQLVIPHDFILFDNVRKQWYKNFSPININATS